MAQFVELPNGDTAEFPDGVSADQITSALQAQYPAFFKVPERTVMETAEDFGRSAIKSAISVPETAVGLLDIPTGGAVGKFVEDSGIRFKDAKAILDEGMSDAQKAANARVSAAKGFIPSAQAMLENPSTIAHGIVESAASMGAGGVVGRGILAAAPKVAGWAAGAIGEGVVGAGSAAEQYRQESKTGELTAAQSGMALASGIGTGVLGAIGGKIANKFGFADVDTMLAQSGSNVTNKGVIRRIIEGGISEGVFEEMPQSAQEQVWQNAATGRPLLEGVPESAAKGLVVGGVMGGGVNALSAPRPADVLNAPDVDAAIATAAASLDTTAATDLGNIDTLTSQLDTQNSALQLPAPVEPSAPALAVTPDGIVATPTSAEAIASYPTTEQALTQDEAQAELDPAEAQDTRTLPIAREILPSTPAPVTGVRQALADVAGVVQRGEQDTQTGRAIIATARQIAGSSAVDQQLAAPFTLTKMEQRERSAAATPPITISPNPTGTHSIAVETEEQATAVTQALKDAGVKMTPTKGNTVMVSRLADMNVVNQIVSRVNTRFTTARDTANEINQLEGIQNGPAPTQAQQEQPPLQDMQQAAPEGTVRPVAADIQGLLKTESPVYEITDLNALPTATAALGGKRMSQWSAKTIKTVAGLFGRKVRFYEGAEGIAEGINQDRNTLYINVDGGVDLLAVAGHEFTHSLEYGEETKETYKAALSAVKGLLTANPEKAAKYRKYYNKEDIDDDGLARELLSDIGGNEWRSGKFWGEVFDQVAAQHPPSTARTIITKLRDAIVSFINKLIKATPKQGFNLEGQGFTKEDLVAARDLIVKASADTMLRNTRERLGLVTQKTGPTAAMDTDGEVRFAPRRPEFTDQTLPTRWPTSKKVSPSVNDDMVTDLDTLRLDQKQHEKAVEALINEPGMHSPEMVSGTLEEKTEHVIGRMMDNLLWLFDHVPASIRERSKLWYDGARKIAERWSDKYDLSKSQAAGILAVLSPQKDWFMNVTMAERIIDILHSKIDHRFDARMRASAFGFLTKDSVKEDPESRKNLNAYDAIKDKTLQEVIDGGDMRQIGVWIRAYDEAHHDAKHSIVTPEGEFIQDKTTVKGDYTLRAWGDFSAIGKAASIYVDGRPENINQQLGGEHKVRNFYNNIFAPKDARFTTIDTHAVAADLLRPLAGADKPVADNFGKTGGTNVTGLSGTYALHYEAYRRAAEARGVLPREMQSITWEAIRGLFTEGYKGKKDNLIYVDNIWRRVDSGEITVAQAREEIINHAGGVNPPDWFNLNEVLRDKSYKQGRESFGGAKTTFEVAPDPRNAELKQQWDALPANAKREISDTVAWKIAAKALAWFGDENMKGELHHQMGGWMDDTNPSMSIWFNKRAAGSKISDFTRMLGYALRQEGMMRTSLKPFKGVDGKQVKPSGMVVINLPAGTDIVALYQEIRGIKDENGAPYVSGHTSSTDQMVIIYDGDAEKLGQKIANTIDDKYDVDYGTIYAEFPEKGDDNYGLDRNREGEDSPESPLRARSGQLREEADQLFQQLVGGARLSTTRSDGRNLDQDGERAEPPVRYGQATEGSVSALGVHYSQQPRSVLSGAMYGTGIKGAEAKRLAERDADPRIKKRIYFYIDEGKGINPEQGVGAARHEVQLDNLYDGGKDPLQLRAKARDYADTDAQRNNLFEKYVLDAGYDGYKVYEMAVLLGDHNVSTGQAKFSTRRFDTPEFKRWFGKSTIVNADGSPRIMYHGTARDITEFRPKQANAIFLTDNPKFAEGFADMSQDWMVRNYQDILTTDQIEAAKREAIKEVRKGFGGREDLRQIQLGNAYNDFLNAALKNQLPSRANVMPLVVRAEKPFDFRNPEHIAALEKAIGASWTGKEYMNGEEYDTTHYIGDVERGSWNAIEGDKVMDYIKANHDSFYVRENGETNLAVFNPNQVKSASGNSGEYSLESPDIRFSLVRPAEAKKLDAGKKVTLYRAMSMIGGKLYPPMSAKMTDESGKLTLREPEPIGRWMQSEERPDLVPTDGPNAGMFPLKKPGGGTTWALYAPYFHASKIPLNDQFTAAWKNDGVDRPQLVTVEVEVPESEMTSGYQAAGSVKKTGPNKWNSGVVASKVPGGRDVVLSRYLKIKRVVPDAEVAQKIAELVNPNRLRVPENTVTPQLRAELEKNGVQIAPKGTRGEDIRYSPGRQPWYYSALEDAVRSKVPEKLKTQPAAQWALWLKGNAGKLGVKADEIKWSGVEDYLAMRGKDKITSTELADWLHGNNVQVKDVVLGGKHYTDDDVEIRRARYGSGHDLYIDGEYHSSYENRSDAYRASHDVIDEHNELIGIGKDKASKFDSYVLPGGENYKELLITLPVEMEKQGPGKYIARSNGEAAFGETEAAALKNANAFRSSHFDQPNILAHIRMDERTDADGNRVLFLQEIQSDWQQAKRDGKSVPDGPFITDTKATTSLALKRAIAYAVDNGFSRIAWTTGEQQSSRYDLSKQISSLRYNKIGDEYGIVAIGNGSRSHLGDGIIMERTVPESGLEEIVGKDLAQKIINGEGEPAKTELNNGDVIDTKSFSGLDLKVGGEGMKGYYDAIVPQVAKKLGAEVGSISLTTGKVPMISARGAQGYYVEVDGDGKYFKTRDEARAWADAKMGNAQPGFTIPDSMKQQVAEKGMPLFSTRRAEEISAELVPKIANHFSSGSKQPVKMSDNTPATLQLLGWKDLPVFIQANVLDKMFYDHGITKPMLARLPFLLHRPMMIFGDVKNGSLVFAGDDLKSGKVALVAMKPTKGTSQTDWKDNSMVVTGYEPQNGWDEVAKRVMRGELLYRDTTKSVPATVTSVLQAAQKKYAQAGARLLPREILQGRALQRLERGYTVLGQSDLVKFADENDIAFSTPRSQLTGQPINQSWTNPDNLGPWDEFVRKMQDKLIDTKRIVAEIRKAGIAIRDTFDPYLQEILYHGRAAKRVADFADNELKPLLVEMQARGIEMQEFEDYLWARHAGERNAQIAKVNPKMPDGGSGLTNAEAANILAGQVVTKNGRDIQIRTAKLAGYQSLANKVKAINDATLDTLVADGLETQQTVDAWRNTYGNYVPLMRDMEADDNYAGAFNLGTGKGFSVRGAASKRALGSERSVIDILANVAMQRERAITRGEKNKVAMAAYGLSLTAPNPDFWLTINPDAADPVKLAADLQSLGVNPADAQNIAKEPKQRYTDPNTGMVVERINPALRNRDDVLAVRINGQDRFLMFSNDERSQHMVRNLKNLDTDQLGEVMSRVATVTRYFSSVNTQYNPVFGLTNGIRDLGSGMLNLSSTPLKGQRAKVAKYAFSALKGIYSDLRDHRKGIQPTSQWALEFEEFQREGGQTGYRDMFATSAERAKGIAEELKNAGKGQRWLAVGEKNSHIFGWLSDYNTSIENAVRLAAYKAAKEDGMSVQQAAALAKNLTVNFNKKGLAATQAGALYAFFNAAVQGTARIGETMLTRDANGKFSLSDVGKKIAYGGVMLGVLQAVLAAAAGWDDDEPPQFAREKNFIIPMPGGKYVSIPMPLGFHVLTNLGRIPTELALSGFKKPGERLVRMASVVMDAFNPIGSSTFLQTLTPTIIDPVAALAENQDFTGKSIYKEDFNKMKPTAGWTRTKDTASDFSKAMAYGINYITGGGKYGIGIASPTPDQIDYLIGQATGGVGRETLKLWQAGKTEVSGEELPMYKVPVVGRFVGETTGTASETSRFYDNLKRIGEHASALKEIKDAKDSKAYVEYMRENPDARMVQAADKASRELGYLKRMKRDALERGDKEKVKALEERIKVTVSRWNERLGEKQN